MSDKYTTPKKTTAPKAGGNPFMNFIQSDGGSSLISTILGGIGGIGESRQQERMSQEQMAEMQRQSGVDDRYNRDIALNKAAPTGWAQNYQQQTLLKDLMLQRFMSGAGQLMPADPEMAARLKEMQGPKPTISAEWQQQNPYGVDQTMQSIGQRQGVLDLLSQGRGPGFNFGASGYDPQKAQALDQSTTAYRNSVAQNGGGNPLANAVNMGRQGQMPQQGGGGSRLGSAASGAMTGASLGSFIPGIGTGIGAGIGGLVGLLRGGGGGSKQPQINPATGQPMGQPFNPAAYNQQQRPARNPYL